MDYFSHARFRLCKAPHLLVMKLLVLFLFFFFSGHAEGVTQGKVTLNAKNASLDSVLKEIAKQAGLGYTFTTDIGSANKVTISVKDAPVADALNICFKNQPYSYSILNNTIVVREKKGSATESYNSAGPGKTVRARGVVYNEAGQPLSGANVTIKESGKGIITNARGEYEFVVPSGSILLVSFIGYAPEIVEVSEDQIMQVYLSVAKNELDKVVVQAYGTTTQRLATGNIATVTAAEIERQPVMNPLQAIEGKVPGLIVSPTNGYASAPYKVEIRGRSIIDPSHASEPLYIIDGVPLTVLDVEGNGSNYAAGSKGFIQNGLFGPAKGQSPMFSINPNDIETITVLKDADATAIYGSRGANGVIIINTKKGVSGKTKFEINGYQGESEITQHYNMLNTQQYLSMRREAFLNDGITANSGNAYDLLTWDTTQYTDWQKYLWGNKGEASDIQLSLSGGDKQTLFRVSGDYHRETDILAVSGANERASVQFNLSRKSVDQKLNLSFTSTYSYSKSDIVGTPGNVLLPPDAPPVYNSSGHLNWDGWQPVNNPFSSLLSPYTAKTGFLNTRLLIEYNLLRGLIFSANLGYSSMHNSQLYLQPIASKNPIYSPQGQADFGNNNLSNAIIEPQLSYKKRFGKSTFEAFVGASAQSELQDGNHIVGSGYINDNLLQSVSNAPNRYAVDNNGQYKYAAIFTRITFNWANKYIINLSARRDGSSRFGPGKQFGNFGAIGGAYIISEEGWFKRKLSFLSFAKLRGSYGLTGSDNLGDYKYLSQWANTTANYQVGLPSYIPLLHSNPNLEWQVNKKLETALSLGFLKDKISLDLSWYQNRCSNELVQIALPTITGFGFVTSNLPATIQNTGFEAIINTKIVNKSDLGLSLNFNIGINRNKLISYPNLLESPYASTFVIGQSLNIVKLLHYTGVDKHTGQYTFEDRNHDTQINTNPNDTANDLYNKDLSVKFDGGFGMDIRYKQWQLNLFFHFRKQEEISNLATLGTPGGIGNFPTEIMNRWQKADDDAKFARFTTQPQITDINYSYYSDGVYSDGSYIRLQNISLSYDLPVRWLTKLGIQACKLYLHGQNIFLITKYKGLDPDTPVFGGMPPAKVFAGGFQFTL